MSLNCNQAAQVVTPGIAVFTWDYSQMTAWALGLQSVMGCQDPIARCEIGVPHWKYGILVWGFKTLRSPTTAASFYGVVLGTEFQKC